ncbi:hypothetical protein [Zemynaea arenosa]|uniref:hypothetical protein n=1 Tax=Zemynaea arenosa TaxID=2561931 RepID=UPI001431D324|nr:hypothetical protein [Massilia arenosa]
MNPRFYVYALIVTLLSTAGSWMSLLSSSGSSGRGSSWTSHSYGGGTYGGGYGGGGHK